MFEVDGDECQRRRNRNLRRVQLLPLPGLRGGVVDLEYSQARIRITVGEGIESCTEDNILPYSVRDGVSKFILGVAAARRHESTEGTGKSVVLFGVGLEVRSS